MEGAVETPLTLIGVALAPIVIGVGWGMWETEIAPRLIPKGEIKRLADEIEARYGDGPQAAFVEEYAAWARSYGTEQGKWRRVRRELQRRARAAV